MTEKRTFTKEEKLQILKEVEQEVTLLSLKTQDTIMSGNYFVNNNIAYINGIWKQNTVNGTTHAKGLFKISNSNNEIGLTTSSKKADSLQIETEDIFYYQGFRNKYPAILQKLPDNNYSLKIYYNDKNRDEKNDVISLELIVDKSLIKKYGFYSIDDFIYYTPNIKQTYANGDVFIGKVENIGRNKDNQIIFNRKEGEFKYSYGNIDEEELTKQSDGNYKYQIIYSDRNKDNVFARLEIIVNKSLIKKYGFWATGDYLYYTPNVKYTYKNGNIFIGKVKNIRDTINNSVKSQLTEGKLKYVTGEEFQGNISGQWFCGIPISGKMIFTDGSIKNGNWLEKFNLDKKECDKVSEGKSPTEKLNIAKTLYKEKQYQNAINKADFAFSNEDYLTAKDWYLNALTIKPDKSKFINSQIDKINELYEKQIRRKELIHKYGEYYGNKILEGKLVSGMSQAMVNEVWDKNFFRISTVVRNNKTIEIWEFDKEKMQIEIIKEGTKNKENRDGAAALILMMNLSEKLGGLTFPQMLIFTNNKLTDIYK